MQPNSSPPFRFKQSHSFQQRRKRFQKLQINMTNIQAFIPIVLTPNSKSKNFKNKGDWILHMHPRSNIASFRMLLQQKLKLKQDQSIYIYVEKKVLNMSKNFGEIYNQYRNQDGFLYVGYMEDNPFGGEIKG